MGRKIIVDNAQLIGAALEAMGRGKTVVMPLKGDSMRPLLKGGRDMVKLGLCVVESLCQRGQSQTGLSNAECSQTWTAGQSGSVVLAEVEKGRYVLHRVVRVEGDRVTLMGDGNTTPEHCRREDVKAVAVSFCIRGRWYDADSLFMRFYCKVILRIVRLVGGLRVCLCR